MERFFLLNPLKIFAFETPDPSEFPLSFHRVGMDIFWNCTLDHVRCSNVFKKN